MLANNIIKRFRYTCCNPTFTKNNKTFENLLREQIKYLDNISGSLKFIGIVLFGTEIIIILK